MHDSQCPLPSAPCPVPYIKYPQDHVPVAGRGRKGGLGAYREQERFPGAPAGCPSPGQGEKRPPAPSLCVDVLITSPTSPPPGRPPRGEALLQTPSRGKHLPVGPQSRSCSFSAVAGGQGGVGAQADSRPQTREQLLGLRSRGQRRGQAVGGRQGWPPAGGRGVKCGISCCAFVPGSLPSAGLFDVGVRQGLPLPPLHTRAHAHTRTRTTLCRQGSGSSKVTDSLPRSPSSILSRIYPLLPYSRALFSIPARAGERQAEAHGFPSMPCS